MVLNIEPQCPTKLKTVFEVASKLNIILQGVSKSKAFFISVTWLVDGEWILDQYDCIFPRYDQPDYLHNF